jgi:hypothetical protein
MEVIRRLKFANYKKPVTYRSFAVNVEKDWINKYYGDDLKKMTPHDEPPEVRVGRLDPALIIMPLVYRSTPFTFDVAVFFKSSGLEDIDENKKAFFLYSKMLGTFISGEDVVIFKNIKKYTTALEKALEPFTLTGFVAPHGRDIIQGLDFEKSIQSKRTIKELFQEIERYLESINNIVTDGLLEFAGNNDINVLKECKENLLRCCDRQVEMYMWAVIRKVCRQLNFKEAREELIDPAFYIILAADAKLLERYKDNYTEILNSFIDFSLPKTYSREIADLIGRTSSSLKKAINLLYQVAYRMSPMGYKDTIEESRKLKQDISEATLEVIEECEKLGTDIEKLEKLIKEKIAQELKQLKTINWIWGYSRIFDRLYRHRKRVLNIVQSGSFEIPVVD